MYVGPASGYPYPYPDLLSLATLQAYTYRYFWYVCRYWLAHSIVTRLYWTYLPSLGKNDFPGYVRYVPSFCRRRGAVGCGGLLHIWLKRDDAWMQVCIVCIVCMYVSVSLGRFGPGRRWNGWTNEVFTTVWYGMVRYYLWAEKGCLYVCVRACVRACVHVCWAVLGWAVLCGACAVLASLSESNEKKMKVKDKKRKKEKKYVACSCSIRRIVWPRARICRSKL